MMSRHHGLGLRRGRARLCSLGRPSPGRGEADDLGRCSAHWRLGFFTACLGEGMGGLYKSSIFSHARYCITDASVPTVKRAAFSQQRLSPGPWERERRSAGCNARPRGLLREAGRRLGPAGSRRCHGPARVSLRSARASRGALRAHAAGVRGVSLCLRGAVFGPLCNKHFK